jgi:hypothetical protein
VTVRQVTPAELLDAARAQMRHVDTVIDVGSAYGPQAHVPYNLCICIEPHPEYIKFLRRDYGNDPRCQILQGTWQECLTGFADQSAEVVTAFDTIEHMTKAEGWLFLSEAQRVARQSVILNTPLGFYPQNYDDPSLLINGVPGLHWQTHKSGWTLDDFDSTWDIIYAEGVYRNDGNLNELETPIGMLWAFWNRK